MNLPVLSGDETKLIRLARDIAVDMQPVDVLLDAYGISPDQFAQIATNQRFIDLLTAERTAWLSALNTHERVKLKAGALVEEWLPELYARMNDPKEPLNAKVEAGKLAARLAGMGLTTANVEGGGGERFSININLGADNQLRIEKNVSPAPEIDYDDA